MGRSYTKSKITEKVKSYFKENNCKNLYTASCINYTGETKDTKENYSKVIVDYLVEHSEEFKKGFDNIIVKRESSYKTESHKGKSSFDFDKRPKPKGERREEKIAHAMFCQYKDKSAVFGKILDYQIPLKNKKTDTGLGKIDLLSAIDGFNPGNKIIYLLELKKDESKETLLRCILEAYTYSKIIDKAKLCKDFSLPYKKDEFIIAPLVHKGDGFETQLEYVRPLIKVLDIPVEIFVWEYKAGKYSIKKLDK